MRRGILHLLVILHCHYLPQPHIFLYSFNMTLALVLTYGIMNCLLQSLRHLQCRQCHSQNRLA